VRSNGDARVLTIDKKTLLLRIQEDPSMAFYIMQTTIGRIRKLNVQVSGIKANYRRDWDSGEFDNNKNNMAQSSLHQST